MKHDIKKLPFFETHPKQTPNPCKKKRIAQTQPLFISPKNNCLHSKNNNIKHQTQQQNLMTPTIFYTFCELTPNPCKKMRNPHGKHTTSQPILFPRFWMNANTTKVLKSGTNFGKMYTKCSCSSSIFASTISLRIDTNEAR